MEDWRSSQFRSRKAVPGLGGFQPRPTEKTLPRIFQQIWVSRSIPIMEPTIPQLLNMVTRPATLVDCLSRIKIRLVYDVNGVCSTLAESFPTRLGIIFYLSMLSGPGVVPQEQPKSAAPAAPGAGYKVE